MFQTACRRRHEASSCRDDGCDGDAHARGEDLAQTAKEGRDAGDGDEVRGREPACFGKGVEIRGYDGLGRCEHGDVHGWKSLIVLFRPGLAGRFFTLHEDESTESHDD